MATTYIHNSLVNNTLDEIDIITQEELDALEQQEIEQLIEFYNSIDDELFHEDSDEWINPVGV